MLRTYLGRAENVLANHYIASDAHSAENVTDILTGLARLCFEHVTPGRASAQDRIHRVDTLILCMAMAMMWLYPPNTMSMPD